MVRFNHRIGYLGVPALAPAFLSSPCGQGALNGRGNDRYLLNCTQLKGCTQL